MKKLIVIALAVAVAVVIFTNLKCNVTPTVMTRTVVTKVDHYRNYEGQRMALVTSENDSMLVMSKLSDSTVVATIQCGDSLVFDTELTDESTYIVSHQGNSVPTYVVVAVARERSSK